jgi:hypothetical protein
MSAMTPVVKRVLLSLVPVICPPEAERFANDIVAHMGLTLGASPPVVRTAFAAGCLAYDLGALPRYLRRASALTGAKAEAYYQSWEHGLTPVHVQLARAINQLMSLSCYEQPEMLEAIGYRPAPWMAEMKKKRLTVYADDVRAAEQKILAPDPLRPSMKREVA